jgi:hypothetical protein
MKLTSGPNHLYVHNPPEMYLCTTMHIQAKICFSYLSTILQSTPSYMISTVPTSTISTVPIRAKNPLQASHVHQPNFSELLMYLLTTISSE